MFCNISLNVLRTTFFNRCNLLFLRLPNIRNIRVKVGTKANYFSCFMSSCINRFSVFNNLFALTCSQPKDKQNHAHDFLLFKHFLKKLLLTVFIQDAISKFAKLLL